ncbi:hypothetical protein RJ640_000202, partial [Escallonia rubra]
VEIYDRMVALVKLERPGVDIRSLLVEGVTYFNNLLAEENPPIDRVVDSGLVPYLVKYARREDYPRLQFEAFSTLANIASGEPQHTEELSKHGAFQAFVVSLQSFNDQVREQALWALANVAGNSREHRDLILQFGACDHVVKICDNAKRRRKHSMLRTATWTLSNFCVWKPLPKNFQRERILATLASVIEVEDEEVLDDACLAFSYLSEGTGEEIQYVIDAGVCPRLITFLGYQPTSLIMAALRTIGNITTGNVSQTQAVLEHGALSSLLALLNHDKKHIKKEVCWAISNITAGNRDQIQAVIDARIVSVLVQLLTNAEFEIKREAACAMSNAISGGSYEQLGYLEMKDCIKPFCDLAICSDPEIVISCLEGLEKILMHGEASKNSMGHDNEYVQLVEEVEGREKIELLQTHYNNEIYEKAMKILKTYWSVEDDDHLLPGDTI